MPRPRPLFRPRARSRTAARLAFAAAAFALTLGSWIPAAHASSYSNSISSYVSLPSSQESDIVPALAMDASTGTQYMITASPGSISGPTDPNPITWTRFSGTSLDNLTQASAQPVLHGFNDTDNDHYWLGNVWVDNSVSPAVWYGLVHVEYHYPVDDFAAAHLRRVDLAESTDDGVNWTDEGSILTPDANFSPPVPGATSMGDGDRRLVVDTKGGYFYIFYWTGYYSGDQNEPQWHPHINVARCPITDKMAPGCWTKWDNGSFSQPGLGGSEGTVLPFTAGSNFNYADVPLFNYDSYLGEFIAVGHNWISTATDLSAENWTDPQSLSQALDPRLSTCNYLWAVNQGDDNPYSLGATWRYYGTGFACNSGSNAVGYQTVTLANLSSGTVWYASDGYAQDQWRYEYSTDGDQQFTPMTYNQSTGQWAGNETFCTVFGPDLQHPGVNGCDSSRTWVAPYAAKVTLGANGPVTVAAGCNGNTAGVTISIRQNGKQIWPTSGTVTVANGGSYTFPSGVTAMVQPGDNIEFVVAHAGTANYCDSTTWDQTVAIQSADATAQFSGTQGPQWSYDYSADGDSTYQPMSYNSSIYTWASSDPTCNIWNNGEQPGAPASGRCDAVRSWTAPVAGNYLIGANGPITVDAACDGNSSGVNISILETPADGRPQVWPEPTTGSSYHIPNGGQFNFPAPVPVTLQAGQTLRFVVSAAGSTNYCDATSWDPVVTPLTDWEASPDYTTGDAQWRYEYSTDGDQQFTPMTYNQATGQWAGNETFCTVFGPDLQHPGVNGCDSSRTWVAPYAAKVTLGANGPVTVAAGCNGNTAGVTISIRQNGKQIWPTSGTVTVANGGTFTFPSGVTAMVQPGDNIEFVVAHAGTANYCDSTTWDQTVTPS